MMDPQLFLRCRVWVCELRSFKLVFLSRKRVLRLCKRSVRRHLYAIYMSFLPLDGSAGRADAVMISSAISVADVSH